MLVLFTIYLIPANAQKSSKMNEPINVLSKWEGNWERKLIINKSLWIPEKIVKKGFVETQFVLHKKYQESNIDESDSETKEINRYEPVSKKYNKWVFQSNGNNSFWYGDWDESNKTMTWHFVDFSGSGIVGKMIEQFKTDQRIETTVIMEDSKGTKLLDVEIINSLLIPQKKKSK